MEKDIIFGTWQITDADTCRDAVSTALHAGYRHIDTAADYENEAAVGDAVRNSGIPRGEVIVTSKLSAMIKDPAEAKKAIDASLEKIDLGYLDYMLIHAPRPWGAPVENHYYPENQAIWEILEGYVRGGLIRNIGLSNFDVTELDDILSVAKIRPAVNQIKCHIGNYPRTLAEKCRQEGVQLTGFSTICTNELLDRKQLIPFAEKYHTTIAQLCIAFSLQLGFSPIVKSTNPQHIAANRNIDFTITAADMETLATLPGLISHRYGDPQPYESH
jgi:diketogulonate reductase-like aldo/keto reductase